METTEIQPHSRTVDHAMEMSHRRFGKADSERAWSWLSSFTDFKRVGSENYKDFWTRFTRCVTRLNAHGLAVGESIVFHRAIQALGIPDGQLHILLAALETSPNPTSVESMKALAIKMYEAHRGKHDSSEVFAANVNHEGEEEGSVGGNANSPMKPGKCFCRNRKRCQNPETNQVTLSHANVER